MFPSSQFELADAVQLDQADTAVRAQLDRVKPLLADRQWDEAVEILRQLAETSEGKLLGVSPHRFIGLRDWCQLRLAALPPEALKLYRSRVDPVAQKWYEQGIAKRDRKLLQNIVDQAFASSFGDDALMALGEMALESGDYAAARWNWERIVPVARSRQNWRRLPQLPPQPSRRRQLGPVTPTRNLDLAAVRARLVLVSILEGATDRPAANWPLSPSCIPTPKAASAAARADTSNCWNRCWPRAPRGRRRRPIPTGRLSPAIRSATRPPRRWSTSGAVAWRIPLRPAAGHRRGPMGAKTDRRRSPRAAELLPASGRPSGAGQQRPANPGDAMRHGPAGVGSNGRDLSKRTGRRGEPADLLGRESRIAAVHDDRLSTTDSSPGWARP